MDVKLFAADRKSSKDYHKEIVSQSQAAAYWINPNIPYWQTTMHGIFLRTFWALLCKKWLNWKDGMLLVVIKL